jgi:hypothetical protein
MDERVNVLEQGQTSTNNKLVVIIEYHEYVIALYNHCPLTSNNSNSNMSSILSEAYQTTDLGDRRFESNLL